MEEIIVLVDYKLSFGSKFNSDPPYTGLDLSQFKKEMNKHGYSLKTIFPFQIDYKDPSAYQGKKILYQSSESNDQFGEYKSYIDDILYFLELAGAELVPKYRNFKAHSNKVFMELERGFLVDENIPVTRGYGTMEDFLLDDFRWDFPVVVKKAHGAQSNGVFKASSYNELKRVVRKVSKSSFTYKEWLKEKLRKFKYGKNYTPFSVNRNKFIIQSFTPNLSGDYKILIFNDIFFVIKRENRPNDFRASGGGFNSFLGDFEIPEGLLPYSYKVYLQFNCPYISLDVGVNENGFHLIEFQFVNFGTSAHSKSKYCIKKQGNEFLMEDNIFTIEQLYSDSLISYFNK